MPIVPRLREPAFDDPFTFPSIILWIRGAFYQERKLIFSLRIIKSQSFLGNNHTFIIHSQPWCYGASNSCIKSVKFYNIPLDFWIHQLVTELEPKPFVGTKQYSMLLLSFCLPPMIRGLMPRNGLATVQNALLHWSLCGDFLKARHTTDDSFTLEVHWFSQITAFTKNKWFPAT